MRENSILSLLSIPMGTCGRLACSRRSDSRAPEKNSRRKKKRVETRGGKGERTFSRSTPPPPPVFPVYNSTRLPLTPALYYLNAWNRLADVSLVLSPLQRPPLGIPIKNIKSERGTMGRGKRLHLFLLPIVPCPLSFSLF